MQRLTDDGMSALGGPTAVAELMEAPVTTVHAFKRKISRSRLAHLKLAAEAAGKQVDWNAAVEALGVQEDHAAASASKAA